MWKIPHAANDIFKSLANRRTLKQFQTVMKVEETEADHAP